MLIEFSVGNYRSFKEIVTFSMVAADLEDPNNGLENSNIFAVDEELKLLKSSAIYGANASGKSNLAKALEFMKWFAVYSFTEAPSTDEIDVEPFRLSTETEGEPSHFELVFVIDGTKYRYGFEATPDRVTSEWLFHVPKLRETKLFERNLDVIKSTKKYGANGIEKFTRSNALFLSVCAQFNLSIAELVLQYMTDKINIISGLQDRDYFDYTVQCMLNNENRSDIVQLIKRLDLGINDIQVEKKYFTVNTPQDEVSDTFQRWLDSLMQEKNVNSIKTIHRKFDDRGNYKSVERFDLEHHESEGTQKIFALAGILIAAFKEGKVLIVDEFDARLHPLISLEIAQMFNSNETNMNNGQLIFMTHDTNLLNKETFRRDQIWFTEKDRYGATDLYSLAEYKVGDDMRFEHNYLKGRYGAIPYLGSLKDAIDFNG